LASGVCTRRRLWRSWDSRTEGAREAASATTFGTPFHQRMASVLLKFLRILCLARRYVRRASSRWALFIALIGRKLNEWWRWWPGKLRNTKLAESSFPGNAGLCSSASGGPAVLREYIVAASNVPASASQRSLHERAERQPATSPRLIPATLSVDQSYNLNPYRDRDYLSPGNYASHSSSNVSFASSQSRASDRLSIINASREALHASIRQPSEIPRSTHPSRQFGRSPDPSRSRGRLSRSPSPMPPPNATQQSHHLVQTGVSTHAHKDGRISPMVGRRPGLADLPSSSSNTQEPQSPSRVRGRKRTTSVVWNVENPSSESLSVAVPDLPQLTEEPTAMGSPAHSSFGPSAEHIETAPQLAIITSSFALPELRYSLPANRFLDQITSDEVPRYTKNYTMQVGCAIIFTLSLHVFTDPVRKRHTL
jgi:hypothetical protein